MEKLTNNQVQVILTGILGDGHISKNALNSAGYKTNCKYKEYLDFKKELLGDLFKSESFKKENGFSKTPIYFIQSKYHKEIKQINEMPINTAISLLDELGIALWFYDDGSLHKTKNFYNLNTHAFSKEIQEQIFIPFFNKLEIYPKIRKEKKKDGREFYYLVINIHDGAYEVNKILRKYPILCYSYKLWNEDFYQYYKSLKNKNFSKKEIFQEIRRKARVGKTHFKQKSI